MWRDPLTQEYMCSFGPLQTEPKTSERMLNGPLKIIWAKFIDFGLARPLLLYPYRDHASGACMQHKHNLMNR